MKNENYNFLSEDLVNARKADLGKFLLFDYNTNCTYYIFNNTIIVEYYDEPDKFYRQTIYREVPNEAFRELLENFKSINPEEIEYLEQVEQIINNIEETNKMNKLRI